MVFFPFSEQKCFDASKSVWWAEQVKVRRYIYVPVLPKVCVSSRVSPAGQGCHDIAPCCLKPVTGNTLRTIEQQPAD